VRFDAALALLSAFSPPEFGNSGCDFEFLELGVRLRMCEALSLDVLVIPVCMALVRLLSRESDASVNRCDLILSTKSLAFMSLDCDRS
jgi:hypothetical protein